MEVAGGVTLWVTSPRPKRARNAWSLLKWSTVVVKVWVTHLKILMQFKMDKPHLVRSLATRLITS